jgi:ABC-type cobalamin/Fe3+-siderophores transport system ATPase subunit
VGVVRKGWIPVSEASTTRLEVRNLALRRGRRRVIEDVSFRVERGETLGLLGPNGCGKTSVLMALVGLVGIERGEILLDGTPVDETRRRLRERPASSSRARRSTTA